MKKNSCTSKSLFIYALLFVLATLTSCASTKYYNSQNVDVISDSEEDSSIHYVKESISIRSDCSFDKDLFVYKTVTEPAMFVWFTVRETGRVTFYTTVNVFSGLFSYYSAKDDGDIFGFYLPNLKQANKEYYKMIEEYHQTDAYKYRKYMKPLSKAKITRTIIKEDVDWNEEIANVSSTTETLVAKNDVKKSAEMMSKKASIVGSTIGKYTSYVVGIPGWICGFIIGAALDD